MKREVLMRVVKFLAVSVAALLALPVLGWAGAKAGLEVVADQNVSAGTLSPGQTVIVQLVKVADNDVDNDPVHITGLAVFQDLNGTATVTKDIAVVEVLWGTSPTGPWIVVFRLDTANPGTGPSGWDPRFYQQTSFPTAPRGVNLTVPDEGVGYLAVRVTVSPNPTPGNVVRPALAIWTREGEGAGAYHLSIAIDGTEEVIGPAVLGADAGLEYLADLSCLPVQAGQLGDWRTNKGYGVLSPGAHAIAMAFDLKDMDGGADNDPVRITALDIDFWHGYPAGTRAGLGAPIPGPGTGFWANDGATDITEVWVLNSAGIPIARASFNGTTWNGSGVTNIDAGAFRVTFPNSNWSTVYTIPDDGWDTFYIQVWISDPIQTEGHIVQPTVTVYQEEGVADGGISNTYESDDIIRTVADGKPQAIQAWPTTWTGGSLTGLEASCDQATGAGSIQPGIAAVVQTVYLKDLDAGTQPVLIQTMSVRMDYVQDSTKKSPPALNMAPSPSGAIQRIEILYNDVVVAEYDGVSPNSLSWDSTNQWWLTNNNYTPISLEDEGAATLKVRLTLDPAVFGNTYNAGDIVRTALDIVATEPPSLTWGGTTVKRYAIDGRDEVVGGPTTVLGLETVADRGIRYDAGYLERGMYAVTMEFDLIDRDADNFPVIVTTIYFGLDDYNAHDIAVLCTDIHGIQFLDKDNNIIAEAYANTPGSFSCGVQWQQYTGIGWVIPDDTAQILKVRILAQTLATLGHIVRAGVGIVHTEGGTVFTKCARDGYVEEIGTAPVTPGPGPSPTPFSNTYGIGKFWVSVPVNGVQASQFGTPLYTWNGRRWEPVPATATLNPNVGYWAKFTSITNISVTDPEITSDVTIPLIRGYNIISAPWKYRVANIQVMRGTETKSWDEAVRAGWVYRTVTAYQASRYKAASVIDPWYGYRVRARVDGLSLKLVYSLRETSATTTALEPQAEELEPGWDEPMPEPEGVGAADLQFLNTPNPIRDVHTTTFKVVGPLASWVTEIKVQVFDLSGRLVWEGNAPGAELVWHTEDFLGRYLANGVYLYRIMVKVGDTWVSSELKKLAIYR